MDAACICATGAATCPTATFVLVVRANADAWRDLNRMDIRAWTAPAVRTAITLGALLPVMAALPVATPLAAQLSFGGRAGMTLSSLATSDEGINVSPIAGMHAGITASLMRGGVGLVVSAAYSERGTGFDADDIPEDLDFRYRLAYVELGAFGKLPLFGGTYLLAGPTAGLRVSCSASVSAGTNSQSANCRDADEDPFKGYDLGASGGAGIAFDAIDFDMVVEVLYGVGLLNISGVANDSARHRGFMLRVGVDL